MALTFNGTSAANISGTPTTPGTYPLTVNVVAYVGNQLKSSDFISGSIVIYGHPALLPAAPSLPAATVGTPCSTKIPASGGWPPLTFALATGTLPPGLTLAADGTLSGTPTVAIKAAFTVGVHDRLNFDAGGAYAITVAAAPAPKITSFDPRTASVTGAKVVQVTLTGKNLFGATAVTIAGIKAKFTVSSATAILVTLPRTATTGKFAVTTPSGTATSATAFTVKPG